MVPQVVIVGRPNVGKSSLLNALSNRTVSIVDPIAGVTRDRVSVFIELDNPDLTRPGRRSGYEGALDVGARGKVARSKARRDALDAIRKAEAGQPERRGKGSRKERRASDDPDLHEATQPLADAPTAEAVGEPELDDAGEGIVELDDLEDDDAEDFEDIEDIEDYEDSEDTDADDADEVDEADESDQADDDDDQADEGDEADGVDGELAEPTDGATADDDAGDGVAQEAPAKKAQGTQVRPGPAPRVIELVDTGGYGIEDSQNLTAEIEAQITRGVAKASVILFIVDAQSGVVPLDYRCAQLLRVINPKAPVILIANKVDGEEWEPAAFDATRLGMGNPLCISATTRHNIENLRRAIASRIDFEAFAASARDPRDEGMLLAVVGKRNAGKSSFVNALAQEERVIVSEVEGTTRDSVDVRFEMDGKPFTAIDTAGLRKRKSVQDDIEYYSHHRSLRSVRRSDVCLLVIDATTPVSMVDKQLAGECVEHFKPVVILVNKWDLVEKQHTQEEYAEYLGKSLKGLEFAPIVFTSAKHGQGVREAVGVALELYEQAGSRVSTSELNRLVEAILLERPPHAKGGARPRVYYTTQQAVHPPTVICFVNNPDLFEGNYARFMANRFREELPFPEVPFKLIFRARSKTVESKRTR